MAEVRFDGQVAVVTGAGRNLGRAYAMLLAERGARVVVNDLGVAISDTDGSGDPPAVNPALAVVEEIRAAGGEAVASTHYIADPAGADAMVATAVEAFGTVDILVNNAGVVRQAPIDQMSPALVEPVVDTHVTGTVNVTWAAWRVMREQGIRAGRQRVVRRRLDRNRQHGRVQLREAGRGGFHPSPVAQGRTARVKVNAVAHLPRRFGATTLDSCRGPPPWPSGSRRPRWSPGHRMAVPP